MPYNPQPLDDDDLKAIAKREIDAARSHVATLSDARRENLDMYLGKNLYPSKPGQSSVVTREVLETVEWLMPSLLKVFASTDDVVRFEPQGREDVAFAEQATEYCNFIYTRQNNGFVNTYTWFKDALLSRVGVLKIWWADEPKKHSVVLDGLTVGQLQLLLNEPGVEIAAAEQVQGGIGPDGQPMDLYDVQLTVTEPDGKVCVEPVPPEEYIFLPSCKTPTDPGQGHVRTVTQSDLIAQGYDPAIVDDLPTSDDDDENGERSHRFDPATLETVTRDSRDRASRLVEITEWYCKLDRNGDGITEFLKLTLAGTNQSVLLDAEEIEQPPFAPLSPILNPHRLDGLAVADLVKDLQEIKTAITRQALNSLYLANKPRTWAVDGQVNLQELLNSEAGGVVRVKAPGMLGELNTTFVAGQAFPMLEYIDRTLETRSGISKISQGIDADVLNGGAQNTATGVAAMQSAAQQRVELIARIFAETGVTHAFKLILKLVTRHQQSAKVIRLRNQFVEMDPRQWDGDYDVSVEVGLGTGNKAEQLGILAQIQAIQEGALQNPAIAPGLVTAQEYYNTLGQLVKIAGLKDPDRYFRDPSQQPPAPPQEPPPDPNQMMLQLQAQIEQGKLALQAEKMRREDDLARDKLDADNAFRAAELEMKYGTQFNMAQLQGRIDLNREAMRQQAQLAQQQMQPPPGAMQ